MPKGVYERVKPKTQKQIEASRRNVKKAQRVASSLPKTQKQIEASRRNAHKIGKLPRTEKQIEASCSNIRKAQEVAWKLPKSEKWVNAIKVFSRENIKKAQIASLGYNCHHRNGNHFDDNQFNLQVLTHNDHARVHGKLRNNYSEVILEVKFLTEMYHGD